MKNLISQLLPRLGLFEILLLIYSQVPKDTFQRMLTPPESAIRKSAIRRNQDIQEIVNEFRQASEQIVRAFDSLIDEDFDPN